MKRILIYLLLLVVSFLGVAASYSFYLKWDESRRKKDYIERVTNCMKTLSYGFKINPINRFWSLADESFGNSWRLYFTITYPFDDADRERGDGSLPWKSESLSQWDDDIHHLFCVNKIMDLPRDGRFTHLMAFRGSGTAFEFMEREGLEELKRVAPHAILLFEVCNSKVPWMQAGDLELDKLPHEVNSRHELGIGSAHGYDQFGVGFADGTVWMLDADVPFSELEKFLTVDVAREHDREEVLRKYRLN